MNSTLRALHGGRFQGFRVSGFQGFTVSGFHGFRVSRAERPREPLFVTTQWLQR